MRLTIHMGTHKTGTTAIQDALHAARESLRAEGVLYPVTGLGRAAQYGRRHRALSQAEDGNTRQSELLARLFEEIRQAACPEVILSCETWCRKQSYKGLSRLVAEARAHGLEVRGILYLRNRYTYARSHFREWTENWDNKRPFEKYVRGTPDRWDYVALAKRSNALFGPEMRYYVYDEVGDSFAHFKRELGLPDLPRHGSSNPSLNALSAEIARQANARASRDMAFRAEAFEACRDLDALGDRWSEPLAQPCLEAGPDTREALQELTGLSLAQAEMLFQAPKVYKADIAEARTAINERLAALRPDGAPSSPI